MFLKTVAISCSAIFICVSTMIVNLPIDLISGFSFLRIMTDKPVLSSFQTGFKKEGLFLI